MPCNIQLRLAVYDIRFLALILGESAVRVPIDYFVWRSTLVHGVEEILLGIADGHGA